MGFTRIMVLMLILLLIASDLRYRLLLSSVKHGIVKENDEIYKCNRWEITKDKRRNK